MIRFECPHCRCSVEIDDSFAGRRGRCPGCQAVIAIPAGAPPGSAPPGPSVGTPGAPPRPSAAPWSDVGLHGPRKLTIPESITLVAPASPATAAQPPPDAGRGLTIVGLIFSFLPVLSAVGIVLGAIGWRRAARAGQRRLKRLAIAATFLGILVTLATGVLVVAVFVSAIQEMTAAQRSEQCRMYLTQLGVELDSYANDHDSHYPPGLSSTSGSHSFSYFGWSTECPDTHQTFAYVAGLKHDPADRSILVYDARSAHGASSWFFNAPAGRNVRRVDGTDSFLPEEQFQKEFQDQEKRRGQAADRARAPLP
jgi:hypothetical protein